ncbi:MAG: ATP-binding protein [bacterium]
MKRIFFRDLKIILFALIVLVMSGFFISQQFISKRIMLSSTTRLRQIENDNNNLLILGMEKIKEDALFFASDYKIVESIEVNPLFATMNGFESFSLLWPDGRIQDYAGKSPPQIHRDPLIEKGQSRVFYYSDSKRDGNLLLVATSPFQTKNNNAVELIITKVLRLNKAFRNTLLVCNGKIQAEGADSSFLKPFVTDVNNMEFGSIKLVEKGIFASKMPIPGITNKDTYLFQGLDKRQEFADTSKLLFHKGIISTLILLIIFLSLKVLTKRSENIQLQLNIMRQQAEVDRAKYRTERNKVVKGSQKINEEKTRELEETITSLKIAQAELLHSEKLASIGQLAAGIAHEINTPTQYVGDNTTFLQDSFRDILDLVKKFHQLLVKLKSGDEAPDLIKEIEEYWEKIDFQFLSQEIPNAIEQALEGLSRVSKIVQAMKEFAYIGPGQKTAVDLNHAIESTITVAKNEWKYVADMKTDLDPSLPEVPCFPGDFNQVILNLIVNAAHAIEDVVSDGSNGKGLITISSRRDGEWIEIRVSDTGKGVPEQIQSLIFDPFFTTKEVGKGSGQGLAIAHAVIVEKHGGTITLDTMSDNKTTFVIRLPLNNDTEEMNNSIEINDTENSVLETDSTHSGLKNNNEALHNDTDVLSTLMHK